MSMMMLKQTMRDWYCFNYMGDTLGKSIDKNVTFKDLKDAMDNGEDVYAVIGVGDSVIRERLQAELYQRI